jgi:hypothetical protein
MSAAVQQLLDSFDGLAEMDKHQVAIEILRRCASTSVGDLPDAALLEAAEELFRTLDAEEARHASR